MQPPTVRSRHTPQMLTCTCFLQSASHRMVFSSPHHPRPFRLTTRRARSISSSFFGLTFLACVLTVSAASDLLPCPAHPQRGRFADDGADGNNGNNNDGSSRHGPHPRWRSTVVVEKRPKRWIEEHHPNPNSFAVAETSRDPSIKQPDNPTQKNP